MKTQHTAGPWSIYNDADSGKDAYGIEAFTETGSTKGIAILMNRGFEEAEANARLIAAAPELLETLKKANGLIQRAQITAAEKARKDLIKEAILLIEATISKAVS